MPHVIEKAATGRSKCRGCNSRIAAGLFRFGERLPNPFAEDGGEMTHWFHLLCAAFKRPAPFLETLPTTAETIDDREMLEREASAGITHRRLSRVNTAERSSTGRAVCRSCQQTIPKDTWRITLVYYEDGRFVAAGFIHPRCAQPYLETTDVMRRLAHFTPSLTEADLAEIQAELTGGSTSP
jgi:hypothetical protein